MATKIEITEEMRDALDTAAKAQSAFWDALSDFEKLITEATNAIAEPDFQFDNLGEMWLDGYTVENILSYFDDNDEEQ